MTDQECHEAVLLHGADSMAFDAERNTAEALERLDIAGDDILKLGELVSELESLIAEKQTAIDDLDVSLTELRRWMNKGGGHGET